MTVQAIWSLCNTVKKTVALCVSENSTVSAPVSLATVQGWRRTATYRQALHARPRQVELRGNFGTMTRPTRGACQIRTLTLTF